MKNILRKMSSFGFLIFLMFSIVCMLNVGYTILRSARNALAVVDLGCGAASIPWFELCGTMPGAFLMTLILTYLLNRYSIRRVFFLVLTFFLSFFLIFSIGIYPNLSNCKIYFAGSCFASLIPFFASMLFFVMAELWKVALLTVLFWGLVNRFFPIESAKKYYAPMALGGSLGTVVAGPLISLCTSDFLSQKSWEMSFIYLVLMLTIISIITAIFFEMLSRRLQENFKEAKHLEGHKKRENVSIFESIKVCFQSRYLMLLAWITIADYIAYGLGEVIFLDLLKQKYPDPRQYCDFMGTLSIVNGSLTALCAFVFTPYVLKNFKWVVASLVTPVCLVLTQGCFFLALICLDMSLEIDMIILCGSVFFCLVRAVKYTFFDTSKEISFLMLDKDLRMTGKLVIDGMCGRIGRGGSSMLSLVLIQVCGGVLATSSIAGAIALLISLSCALATSSLGFIVEKSQLQKAAT